MFLRNITVFILVVLLSSIKLNADVHISLGQRVYLDQAGISFRVFKGAESRPIKLPASYRLKKSGKKVYKTKDIWKYKQNLGVWENNYSKIRVCLMLYPSREIDSNFIFPEEINDKFSKDSSTDEWSMEEIESWVDQYFEKKLGKIVGKINLSIGDEAMTFQCGSDTGNLENYLVILPGTKYFNKNIVFWYSFNKEVEKKIALRGLVKSIQSLKLGKPSEVDTNNLSVEDLSTGMVLDNIKNLKGWKAIKTSDYYILTNCTESPTSNAFIKKISSNLEIDKSIYEFFYKEKKSLRDKFVVRIFKDRDDYIAYVGKDASWTGGLWVPSRKELVLYKPKLTSKGETQFFKTLKHEAFHQYIHFAVNEVQSGAWFNEGNAVFMENVELKGGKICIYSDIAKLKYIQEQISVFNFNQRVQNIFKKSYSDFYNDGQLNDNYNLAWGIIYFLYTGYSDIYRKYKRDYSKILRKYYDGLYTYRSNKKAFENAWKGIDLKIFANDLIYYFKYKANSSRVFKY